MQRLYIVREGPPETFEDQAERWQREIGKRPRLYELALDAVCSLSELAHCRPKSWAAGVKPLYELLLMRGDTALRLAIRAADEATALGTASVALFHEGTAQ